MIDKSNFKDVLTSLGFTENGDIFSQTYKDDVFLQVDFAQKKLIYPESEGLTIGNTPIFKTLNK